MTNKCFKISIYIKYTKINNQTIKTFWKQNSKIRETAKQCKAYLIYECKRKCTCRDSLI